MVAKTIAQVNKEAAMDVPIPMAEWARMTAELEQVELQTCIDELWSVGRQRACRVQCAPQ